MTQAIRENIVKKTEYRIVQTSQAGFPKTMEAVIHFEDGKFIQCVYTQGMSNFSTPYNETQWAFLGYVANRIATLSKAKK